MQVCLVRSTYNLAKCRSGLGNPRSGFGQVWELAFTGRTRFKSDQNQVDPVVISVSETIRLMSAKNFNLSEGHRPLTALLIVQKFNKAKLFSITSLVFKLLVFSLSSPIFCSVFIFYSSPAFVVVLTICTIAFIISFNSTLYPSTTAGNSSCDLSWASAIEAARSRLSVIKANFVGLCSKTSQIVFLIVRTSF